MENLDVISCSSEPLLNFCRPFPRQPPLEKKGRREEVLASVEIGSDMINLYSNSVVPPLTQASSSECILRPPSAEGFRVWNVSAFKSARARVRKKSFIQALAQVVKPMARGRGNDGRSPSLVHLLQQFERGGEIAVATEP